MPMITTSQVTTWTFYWRWEC